MTAVIPHAGTPEEERRRRRATWPIRHFRLGEEPGDDLATMLTAEERVAMMWPLAVDGFCMRDARPAVLPRSGWPVKVRRLGDPEVD